MSDPHNDDSKQESDENLRIFPAEKSNLAVPSHKNLFLRDWKGSILFFAGLIAILWGLFSALGSGWGFWGYRVGINGYLYSAILSFAVIILGVIFIVWDRKKGRKPVWFLRGAALLLALIYLGYFLSIVIKGSSVPAIHDISTDLADPPQFQTLELRADNLDNIPGQDDNDMRGLSPLQRWEALHKRAYPDIRSVRIELPVTEVMAKAERLVEARGWELVSSTPDKGYLEATATSALFRYKDDVVLRVKPSQNGAGSIIDMRSVSRVGQSDLGVNAGRVESFLADLSGTTTSN